MSKEESCYLLAHNHIMEPYLPLRLWSLCLILLVIQQVRYRLSVPTILSSGTDTLICKAQEVISKYSWQKEGAAIPARILLFSENDTLVISGARADICGRYTCTVENQLSSNQGHYFHLRYGEIWHEKTSLYFGIVAVLFEVPWLLTICFSCINWICKRGFSLPHVFLSFSDICGNISLVVGLFGFIFKTCGGEHVEVAMAALVVLSAILIVRVLLWFCHRKKKNHQKNACHAAWDTGSRLVVLVAISVLTGLCLKYYTQCGGGLSSTDYLTNYILSLLALLLCVALLLLCVYLCRKNKARQRGDKTLPPEEIQLN
ncbi:uncharacterized protein LOC121318031 isoform X4 [Polyodon spathula]|uniref:uncharacterized protein LOC121318031 isoform X4 n=1 Tax=Polyodon spathula TaxID=7913 RepID=UPI001B7E58F4|nr:uncharacterized protein LOC121318031 isoform X4 [Polyodon spathula]